MQNCCSMSEGHLLGADLCAELLQSTNASRSRKLQHVGLTGSLCLVVSLGSTLLVASFIILILLVRLLEPMLDKGWVLRHAPSTANDPHSPFFGRRKHTWFFSHDRSGFGRFNKREPIVCFSSALGFHFLLLKLLFEHFYSRSLIAPLRLRVCRLQSQAFRNHKFIRQRCVRVVCRFADRRPTILRTYQKLFFCQT